MADLTNPYLEDQLDEIVAAYLKAEESSRPQLQRQLLTQHPSLAGELQSFFDSQERFKRLATPLREVFSDQNVRAAGTVIGGYEILEESARGGMGVVYKARSLTLGRVVALKMLRPGPLTSAADRQRFRSEAQAVADLDYPHIVPIYEVGAEEDHPFFAMKWLPGGSLAEHLSDFRWPHPLALESKGTAHVSRNASDPSPPTPLPRGERGETPAEQKRRVLKMMITVARAVHHAHTRGILHRDLKPANILLDDDGTPCVSDFGLAKRLGTAAISHLPGDTPNLLPLTESGLIVGTPAYMAPEQASGPSGAVSVASDVYSLGAILYEVLTGRPPIRGETTWDTLRQLLSEEPAPARTLNPWVDRDLETICHKCLHKDPGQRYGSAADLAADLERYSQGEPILARPVPRWERFWRWCRRNPALSSVSGLALAALIMVAVGGVLFGVREAAHAEDMEQLVLQKQAALDDAENQRRNAEHNFQKSEENRKDAEKQKAQAEKNQQETEKQKEQVDKSRQKAEEEKEKADASFLDAHQVVFKFCNSVSKELASRPELLPLRKGLLESALAYYKKFLQQKAGDPKLERELADAFFQAGKIIDLLGSKTEALQACEQSLALILKMHKADAANPELRYQLAVTHVGVGSLQHAVGKFKEALVSHTEALQLYQQLAKEFPKEARFPSSAAGVSNNLAGVFRDLGDMDKSLEMFHQAVVERKKEVAAAPKNSGAKGSLALSLNNLGVIQATMNKPLDARKSFEEALELRLDLVKKDPKNSFTKVALAASYRDLGMALFSLGKQAECVENWEKALQLREQMAKEHALIAFYQRDLAGSYQDFGRLHRDNKQYEKSIAYYQKARAIWEKLLSMDSAVPSYQAAKARCDFHLAQLFGLLADNQQELQHYDLARAVQEKLVLDFPQQIDYQADYAQTLHGWGLLLKKRGDAQKAEQALRSAIKHQKIAFDKAPSVSGSRSHLSDHYASLSELLVSGGRLEEALQLTLERRKLWPKSAAGLYAVAVDLAKAAAIIPNSAQRGQYETLAVETLQMAVAAGFKDRKRLLDEPAFKSLTKRQDFQNLLSKLTK